MLKHNDFIVGKFHDQLVIRKTKAGTRSYTILPNVLFFIFQLRTSHFFTPDKS